MTETTVKVFAPYVREDVEWDYDDDDSRGNLRGGSLLGPWKAPAAGGWSPSRQGYRNDGTGDKRNRLRKPRAVTGRRGLERHRSRDLGDDDYGVVVETSERTVDKTVLVFRVTAIDSAPAEGRAQP